LFNVVRALSIVLELEFKVDNPFVNVELPADNWFVPLDKVSIPWFNDTVPCFTCIRADFKLWTPFVSFPKSWVPATNFWVPAYKSFAPVVKFWPPIVNCWKPSKLPALGSWANNWLALLAKYCNVGSALPE